MEYKKRPWEEFAAELNDDEDNNDDDDDDDGDEGSQLVTCLLPT